MRNREAVPLLFILLLTALCTWISFA
ncbi:MAG: hypothetical protein RLZZ297_1840, partial [Chloroflexota bacterium]